MILKSTKKESKSKTLFELIKNSTMASETKICFQYIIHSTYFLFEYWVEFIDGISIIHFTSDPELILNSVSICGTFRTLYFLFPLEDFIFSSA